MLMIDLASDINLQVDMLETDLDHNQVVIAINIFFSGFQVTCKL